MARSSKRKEPDGGSLPVSTAQTLKEYMWGILNSIICKHSTVSLARKSASDMAMKRFRSRVRTEWQDLVDSMDRSKCPVNPGEAIASDEYYRLALTIMFALSNSYKTDWDVTRMADRVKNTRPRADGNTSIEDARLAKYFDNPEFGEIDLNVATIALRQPLDSFMNSLDTDSTTSWRHGLFDPPPGGGLFGAGVLDMSPGWFQQSRDQLSELLYISSDIRTKSAASFLRITANLDVLTNAITSLVSPQQYDAGLAAIRGLKTGDYLDRKLPILDQWLSVYSGFSVIVNRKTPFHRDSGGAPSDYDFLFSGGTHEKCFLEVCELGLRLPYLPGTGVAVAGKVLRHGVESWEGGERICQARFIKDVVHDRLEQPRPDWVCYEDYFSPDQV